MQRQHVGAGLVRYRRDQRRQIGLGGVGGEILVNQRHVEGRVLAAHENGASHAKSLLERERKQQQRPLFAVMGDYDEG